MPEKVDTMVLLGAVAEGEIWQSLLDILLLLGVALVMGMLAERLRQSAIVGYLLAGTLVGPGVLGLVAQEQDVLDIAELGVALLLFAIGLEFSPRRMLSMGKSPLLAGPLQVVLTLIAGALCSLLIGLDLAEAIVIGAMVALSSTACALRILTDRAEIDSPYGRMSLAILLIQDVAVVPLMLIVTAFRTQDTVWAITWQLSTAIVSVCALVAAFYVFFNRLVPKLLQLKTWRRNRDLPVLLAVVMALGAAWVAHWFELSPALGAFVAGILLGVSPFAVQIRADIEPLKTVLVTLFFASVGMFGDVVWLFENLFLVGGAVLAIVIGKGVLVALLAWICGTRLQIAIATAFCLAQVGEFSFVLATIARGEGSDAAILSDTSFRTIVSATVVTLLITPYLIAAAPHVGTWIERRVYRLRRAKFPVGGAGVGGEGERWQPEAAERNLILIIGFGPAGQRAAEDLVSLHLRQLVVVDLNPDNIEIAQRYGIRAQLGDATQREVLEHAGIYQASLVIITVPTPLTSRTVVHLVRHHAPGAMVFARARYHMHRWQLLHAGAHVVVDEEDRVGHQLAAEVKRSLDEQDVD